MKSSFIGYSGEIRIKKYKRGILVREKKLHNSGTNVLFDIICNSLSGIDMSGYAPKYLDLFCIDDSGTLTSLLVSPVSIQRSSITSNEKVLGEINLNIASCGITYEASITRSQVVASIPSVQNGSLYYSILRNKEDGLVDGNILAYFLDSTTSVNNFSIAQDEVYVISWTMTVGNSTSGSSL